ncbi:hypothetical protein RQP46_009658 [Phenoliferia psychrophenolica]
MISSKGVAVITFALAASVALASPVQLAATATGPTAVVRNGTLRGVAIPTFSQEAFLGVRFAQAPVGNLRLRPPHSLNTTFNDEVDAKEYPPFCPGFGGDDVGFVLDEDCLMLNVIRPEGVVEGSDAAVGLWLYGGGYAMGGSGDPRYNGSWVVQRSVAMEKPIIFVSVNYRVAAGGFLYSKEVEAERAGNIGLRDQRLALHWVNENIKAFGGDPKKVTIWGESAGAMSVAAHLLAYNLEATPLFRAGIMESGAPTTNSFRNAAELQPSYDAVVNSTGCSGASSTLDCLRALPFDVFNAAVNASSTAGTWFPVVDGEIIPSYPTEQLLAQTFVHVPLLLGANSDEGTAFGTYGIDNDTALQSALAKSNPALTNHSIESILALYPDDPFVGCPYGTGDGTVTSGLQDKRSFSITGDISMVGPRRLMAQSAAVKADVFSYRFNQVTQNMSMEIGVTHFQEVAYVFSNPLPTQNPLGNRPSDLELAELMTSYWISFIHSLNPNDSGVPNAPYWPNYADQPKNMVFNRLESYAEDDDFRSDGITFVNQLGGQLRH